MEIQKKTKILMCTIAHFAHGFSTLVTGHFLSIDFLYVKTKFLIRVTKCFLK